MVGAVVGSALLGVASCGRRGEFEICDVVTASKREWIRRRGRRRQVRDLWRGASNRRKTVVLMSWRRRPPWESD